MPGNSSIPSWILCKFKIEAFRPELSLTPSQALMAVKTASLCLRLYPFFVAPHGGADVEHILTPFSAIVASYEVGCKMLISKPYSPDIGCGRNKREDDFILAD